MRTIRRWLFHLFSVLSLVLCLAMTALCVRSYWYVDLLSYSLPQTPTWSQERYTLDSFGGRIYFDWVNNEETPGPANDRYVVGYERYCNTIETGQIEAQRKGMVDYWKGFNFLGFHYSKTHDAFPAIGAPERKWTYVNVVVPIWSLILLAALCPAAWLRKRLRRRNKELAGLCPTCGYDLRASKERCPECGTAILAAKAITPSISPTPNPPVPEGED